MKNPQEQETNILIADLIDLKLLQQLQDSFAEAMGVAAVTVDCNGKTITEASNFCTVCNMIRSTKTGLARCQRCDAEGGRIAHELEKPYAYKCAGGLLDAAAPIIIDGEYVGCILCGQVIPTDEREAFIQDIVERNLPLGLPAEAFEAEVRKMEPLSRERFESAVEMLSLTANNIMQNSAANMAQKQLLKEAQERAALQAALQETQIKALKAQINPHFLFNSLTLLGYTALEEGAPRTEEIAYTLSDLLRYSLRNMSSVVELGEEIEMIDQYLTIQKIRFGDRLNKVINLAPGLTHFEIPCMVLQPLVENAVIHGAEPLMRPVTITVNAYQENGRLTLEVHDDGVGMPPDVVETIESGHFEDDGQSLGIHNVFQRLQSEYGSQFSCHVTSFANLGTRLRLNIDLDSESESSINGEAERESAISQTLGNQINLSHIQINKTTPVNHDNKLLTPLG
ncbi:MAG: hypothetical protein CSA11_10325 [Chloroflexi bacterium]|nr:MAG: hypothetical protein CSA11_10325 [Chloroflexota bacterium]